MDPAHAVSLSDLEVTRFFFAVVLLLGSAHVLGYLLHRWGLPRVIGEIGGGVVLGPTLLGQFFPQVYGWIFNAAPVQGKLIAVVYWLGLVLLMFISGFALQKRVDRADRRLIAAVLAGATVLPFAAGWLAPLVYDFAWLMGPKQNLLALRIVIAVAVAVTSIPVLSKIFIDLGIMDSRFAKVVLATATIQDVLLWVALAVATGLVAQDSGAAVGAVVARDGTRILRVVLVTLVFFGVAILIMPRWVRFSSKHRVNLLARSNRAGYALFTCFLLCALASVLQVHIVFGAFMAGIIVGSIEGDAFARVKLHIEEVAMGFFIPLYFAIVGLQLDLVQHLHLPFLLGFLLFTTAFEATGTIVAARLAGQSWLSSVNLGAAMNARGGPGIVLATVAFHLGIINQTFFVTLVLIAILTSLGAGAWFHFVLARGWPLIEDDRRASRSSATAKAVA